MTIIVEIKNTESTGAPVYVDIHHRRPRTGEVLPEVVRTYAVEPGKTQSVAVYSAQVLVVREGLEIPQGEAEQ